MSDDIKHISDAQKKTGSISEAIKRAKQHIRNVGAEDLQEPDGFASGDSKKFLEDPEA
jgi:hypothetical protein